MALWLSKQVLARLKQTFPAAQITLEHRARGGCDLECLGAWSQSIQGYLVGGFNFFYFHPYLGKWSNLTNIFQMGWNHQLDIFRKCFLYIYMAQFCTVSSALKFFVWDQKNKVVWGKIIEIQPHFPPEEMLHLWLQNFILQTYDSISRILAEKLDLDFFFSSNPSR